MKLGNTLRTLLIQDDSPQALLVEKALAGDDRFDLTRVNRVEEAAAILAQHSFDAILLDLSTPGASGEHTVLRIAGAAPNSALVVVGRSDDARGAVEAVPEGAQDFLMPTCITSGCGPSQMLLRRSLCHAVEQKRAEQRLAFLAHHDQLTELLNRTGFRDELERALARARRSKQRLAVLFLDLDRFKAINDRLGHDAGDEVLREFSRRLQRCLRESDAAARLGGDEFLVLVERLHSHSDAVLVARKIHAATATPIRLAGHSLRLTVSIGIAMSRADGPDALIARADAAMYHAKGSARNNGRSPEDDLSGAAGPGAR